MSVVLVHVAENSIEEETYTSQVIRDKRTWIGENRRSFLLTASGVSLGGVLNAAMATPIDGTMNVVHCTLHARTDDSYTDTLWWRRPSG